jgi:hypothetical protein
LGRGRVEERTSGVSKKGMPVRANKGRDTKQGMRQGRGREKVAINRGELVGERQSAREMRGAAHREGRSVGEDEGDREQRFGREEGGESREVGELDEHASAP